jgi:hypothetical protein
MPSAVGSVASQQTHMGIIEVKESSNKTVYEHALQTPESRI